METHKKALSIRQPWAWLVANGYKDIENRSWSTTFRGEFYIHASKTMTKKDYRECQEFLDYLRRDCNTFLPRIVLPDRENLQFGGIIGAATLTNCVTDSDNGWFIGKFGFELEEARVLPFMPCQGTLGFFYPSY